MHTRWQRWSMIVLCAVSTWWYVLLPVGVHAAIASTVQALSASDGSFSCAVVSGQVWCWGQDAFAQLGDQVASTYQAGGVQTRKLDGTLLSPAKGVAAGVSHACAVVSAQAYCWGANASGQLGNNDATHATQDAAVVVLSTTTKPLKGVKSVAVGFAHSCAVVGSNAYCWGNGASKQLGNHTTESSDTAVVVLGADGKPFKGVTAVAAGEDHSCAIVKKQVWCWGGNVGGETGSNDMGSVNYHAAPVLVRKSDNTPLENVTAVAAAYHTSCAITGGQVWCWGNNDAGQLGNNDATHTAQGAAVLAKKADSSDLTGVTVLSVARSHTCAVSAGFVWCWGENGNGELGNHDAPNDQDGAVEVIASDLGSFNNVNMVVTGYAHSCAVRSSIIWCWGENNNGQLGNNDAGTSQSTPVEVKKAIADRVQYTTQVVAGGAHTCSLLTGNVLCWGENNSGQLGNNDTPNDQDVPVVVHRLMGDDTEFLGVKQVTVGVDHSCAVTAGQAWCWGENSEGQLGNRNAPSDSPAAVAVVKANGDALVGVTAVAAGGGHSCAVAGGQVWCWGDNSVGQLGNSDETYTDQTGAVLVVKADDTPLKGVTAVVASEYHTCALAGGGVWCWGNNEHGQLGNGDDQISTNQVVAVAATKADATLFKGVKALDVGLNHSCALTGGQVWCWGDNTFGQLGNPDIATHTGRGVLAEQSGDVTLTKVTALSVGKYHACVVMTAKAWCWGRNQADQLGNNDVTHANQNRAVQVLKADATEFTGVITTAAGEFHTCARTSVDVWCWGRNASGQLGNDAAPTNKNGAVVVRYAYTLLR